MSSSVRQRPGKSSDADSAPSKTSSSSKPRSIYPFSLSDLGRLIVLIFVGSCITSWFVHKEDIWWGHRPQYTKYNFWRGVIVLNPPHLLPRPSRSLGARANAPQRGPLLLTDEQLAQYDGSDPKKPIYLAVNGTIFDVSSGRKFYGPGGSYSFFAGADATRGFVTSCFDTDITPDIRGVEVMYLPVSDPDIDALYTSGELKAKKEQERRQAKIQVDRVIAHWKGFFHNSPKYMTVGKVKREQGWEAERPVPTLCQKAMDGRPTRGPPPGKAKSESESSHDTT
ncbi:MAG: hypothetical protein M1818_005609 [Claussenomyces sp. TS43310]|nr:MAG: hypothetical protein M1818_005609 [Claussenomyces sp. TS43310]